MRNLYFVGRLKGIFVTGTYCELLTCIIVVVPVAGGVKGTKMLSSSEVPPSIFTCINVVVLCVCVGGTKREFKTAVLVPKCTSSNLLSCINVVIFVGVGKMNVNPRFSLQVPFPIC